MFFLPRRSRPTPHTPRRRTGTISALGAVLAALSVATTAAPASAFDLPWWPGPSTPAFNSLTSVGNPDWMRRIPDSTGLGQMSIPGTHDTMAVHGGALAPWYYQTQENHGDSADTLITQLDAGIRAIDIRVRIVNTAFAIHHTNVYQNANLDDVLTKTRAFLAAHPQETVLMSLHGECDGDTTEGGTGGLQIGKCVDDPSNATGADRIRIFDTYLDRYPGLFYAPTVTGTSTADTPTLGQVRGHIVLTGFSGPRGQVYSGFGLTRLLPTPFIPWNECNLDTRWSLVTASLQQVAADRTNTMGSTGLSASCPPFGATYTQVANGYGGKQGMNQRLLDHLQTHPGHTGVISMDWPGGRLIDAIISHNTAVSTAVP
ncbi:phosphatidylinositol-specific phospholipase C domain-containing protein [Streptomyces durhamensis]|uniref:phosphatidylinositol-specific phospholipase C domain-containing protein n=1 Tax=Streptomyces durhamensis TaxID=68194 RepID=UPI00099B5353|nr:phosphatidylinositol-specific phospholipase C domain-containing protein [Streptomyces durhamensis]